MKKSIALGLSLLLALTVLASCGDKETSSSAASSGAESVAGESTAASAVESTGEASADPLENPNIYSGMDYDGRTFTVLTSGVNEEALSEIVPNDGPVNGSEQPERINTAIAERNRQIKEKLGVTIAEMYYPDSSRYGGSTLTYIRNAVNSQSDAFQAVSVCLYDCGTLSMENLLYDLNNVENLDMTNPWWDQSFNESVTIADKIYFTIGDIGINNKNSTPCIFFNQSLIERLGLENPYDLANEHKWTVDKANELASSYRDDTNGDGTVTYDEGYGWGGQYDDMYAMLYGSGVRILSADADGWPYLTLYSERSEEIVQKVLTMMTSDSYISGNDLFGVAQWPMVLVQNAFVEGRCLFYSGGIDVAFGLGEMTDTYGILPVPLLNEEQDDYYSLINTWTTNAFGIAINLPAEEAAFAGAVLDNMGYYSWSGYPNSLAVNYYEVVLKNQKLADEEAQRLLDLIFAARGCELGSIFQIGKVGGSGTTVNEMLGTLIANKSITGFRAAYESYESRFQTDVEAVIEYFRQ